MPPKSITFETKIYFLKKKKKKKVGGKCNCQVCAYKALSGYTTINGCK